MACSGVGGDFRYNLVLEAGHQWLWANHDNAYVHHNVFAGGDNDVGGIYVLYGVKNVRIQNNTIDGLDGADLKTGVNVSDGSVSVMSNLFFRVLENAGAHRRRFSERGLQPFLGQRAADVFRRPLSGARPRDQSTIVSPADDRGRL